jgi:hypothetical protein
MICNHIPGLKQPGTYDEFMDAKAANKVGSWNGSTCISLNQTMQVILTE